VTYSRLPSDLETPEDGGVHAVEGAEPWLDGVEVPLVERKTRSRVAPDIRADTGDGRAAGRGAPPAAAADDLFEPKRRGSRLFTYVAVIAVIALVGGLGVLALTFHAATTLTADGPAVAKDPQTEIADLQKQIDALANSSGPASEETRAKIAELESRLADVEAAKQPAATAAAAPADAAPAVRTITTDGAPAPVAAPPSPRERPATAEAHAAPEATDDPPVMELVAPVTSVAKSAAARVERKSPAGGAKPGGQAADADFIANIEKALADAPADPPPARAAPPQAVSAVPPPAAAAGVAPADEEPGGLVPADAPAADALPNDIGPAIRVIPRAGGPAETAPADAGPIVIAPQAAAPLAATPDFTDPAPATLDQAPPGAFDVAPEPGTPVPPEPIPNVQ